MSTARSSSDSGGASDSGITGIGRAPISSRIRFTPSSGPRNSTTSPSDTMSSGPGSNSQSMPLRIAITHMPVSVGSERSRSVRPIAGASSRIFTRPETSSAWRRSGRRASGMPRRAPTTRAMSLAASPIFSIASAIHSTPAMLSASSGLRAANIAIVRRRRRFPFMRSSSRSTSRASFSSSKKTAAYARSTISSAASFDSTSRSFTFFGWSSMDGCSQ